MSLTVTLPDPLQALEALKDVPNEPDIDAESWNREWAVVEAEMKAI